MMTKSNSSVPYIFEDEDMQVNFHRNFFIRPIAKGRSFYLESFSSFPEIVEIFEFQRWNEFLGISEDIYPGLVPAFYSTLVPTNEDSTSLRSIIGNFEIQVLSNTNGLCKRERERERERSFFLFHNSKKINYS